MGQSYLEPDTQQLIDRAQKIIEKNITENPNFYAYTAALIAIENIQKIINHEVEIDDEIIKRSDIGLLTTKVLDQIDPNDNYLVLHDLSISFLNLVRPQLIPAVSPGSPGNLAYQFYSNEGYPHNKIIDHIRCIYFGKPITIFPLQINMRIQQWRIKTLPQGDYYSDIGVAATDVGINPNGTDFNGTIKPKKDFNYQLLQRLDFLKSTAAAILDFWSTPTIYQTNGGAIQYFKRKEKTHLREV